MNKEHTILDLDVKMAEKVAHGLALATLLPSDMKTWSTLFYDQAFHHISQELMMVRANTYL